MSWWNTGKDDDVIGDQPADLARETLLRIVEEREMRGREKPTLVELLRGIGLLAIADASQDFEELPLPPRQIIAELRSGEKISSGPLDDRADTGDLGRPLCTLLGEMGKVYRERWGRKPRFAEWLESFAFVLRYCPEDFLQDGVDHPPVNIQAECV
jgi:hypothetical protein